MELDSSDGFHGVLRVGASADGSVIIAVDTRQQPVPDTLPTATISKIRFVPDE